VAHLSGPAAHALEPFGVVEKLVHGLGERLVVVKGHDHPGAGAQEILGVEVRR
jgi:hypothetical protein